MASVTSEDCYALLGVSPHATVGELRRAWRRLALRWHPDRAGPDATATFQRMAAAYNVLSDPRSRAEYDRRRGIPSASPSSSDAYRGAPAVLMSRLCGSINVLLASGAARQAKGGVIELFLSAQEAAAGGMITIPMHVPVKCPSCIPYETTPCARCNNMRSVDELFSAWLAVPPGVADGTMLHPSAQLSGVLRPVTFRVRHRPGG